MNAPVGIVLVAGSGLGGTRTSAHRNSTLREPLPSDIPGQVARVILDGLRKVRGRDGVPLERGRFWPRNDG